MSTTTDAPTLAELLGPVGIREYDASCDSGKVKVEQWARKLRTMTDDEFAAWAGSAVLGSAVVQRYRGNAEHIHCEASAAYHESRRRFETTHGGGCTGSTLYERGFRSAWMSQGYDPGAYPLRDCTCGADAASRSTDTPEG